MASLLELALLSDSTRGVSLKSGPDRTDGPDLRQLLKSGPLVRTYNADFGVEAAREAAPCLVLQPQEDLPNSTILDLLLNHEGQELVRPKANQVFLFAPEKQHAKGYFYHACITLSMYMNVDRLNFLIPKLNCPELFHR